MPHIFQHIHRKLRADHGQTLAEYAILAGGIAVTVALTLPVIGRAITGLFQSAAGAFGG